MCQVIETQLNVNQIKDQTASLLYAYGVVKDGLKITNIDFGDVDEDGVVKLKVTTEKE